MKQEMWAYHDFETNEFRHIYSSKTAVELCSPDYFETEKKKKKGKVVKVIVQLAEIKKDKPFAKKNLTEEVRKNRRRRR